jgi:hypothetical protein
MRQVDLDSAMRRFANLEGAKSTPDSLQTYKSRINTAVGDFLRDRENPAGFKVSGSREPRGGSASPQTQQRPSSQLPAVIEQPRPSPNTVDVPIPLRQGMFVHLQGLPVDLRQNEAQKIANVVLAMVAED